MRLEDLKSESFTELSSDEAIELLRQIRLSRRVEKKSTRTTKASRARSKSKSTTKKLTPSQAEMILKMLEDS